MKWMKFHFIEPHSYQSDEPPPHPTLVHNEILQSSGLNVCFLLPRKKRWGSPDKTDAIFLFLICILSQGLAKRGPNLFLEFHPKGSSGMFPMLTKCWLFSTKDNDLHFTICCLSWNSGHPLKCIPSCWSRHPWSNSIRGTHLSCRHRSPCICNNFSVIPIIIGGTDLSQ